MVHIKTGRSVSLVKTKVPGVGLSAIPRKVAKRQLSHSYFKKAHDAPTLRWNDAIQYDWKQKGSTVKLENLIAI